MKKRRPTKEEIALMDKAQLKTEMVKLITKSIMPVMEACISMKVSLWFDCIVEKLEENKA